VAHEERIAGLYVDYVSIRLLEQAAIFLSRRKRGATLIEIMLVLVVSSLFLSVFTVSVFVCFRNWYFQKQRLDLRESAAWGFENFSKDLRTARSFTLGSVNQVTFTVSPYETIDYSRVFTGGIWQLIRTRTLSTAPVTTTTAAVAANVSAFTLQYFDSAGTAIPTPVAAAQLANIRLVNGTLSVQTTVLGNTETVTQRTQLRPRNL